MREKPVSASDVKAAWLRRHTSVLLAAVIEARPDPERGLDSAVALQAALASTNELEDAIANFPTQRGDDI